MSEAEAHAVRRPSDGGPEARPDAMGSQASEQNGVAHAREYPPLPGRRPLAVRIDQTLPSPWTVSLFFHEQVSFERNARLQDR
jgi:hypothetical protein